MFHHPVLAALSFALALVGLTGFGLSVVNRRIHALDSSQPLH